MPRRALAVCSAALLLAALLALAPAAFAEEGPDTGPAPTPAAAPSGDNSGATAVDVATEAEYRQALTDLSADSSGPHTITILTSFTISTAGDPTYSGDQDLTIDGGGNTVTSGVVDTRFLDHNSTADLTIEDLTVTGFDNFDSSGGAIVTNAEQLTVTRSTFSDNTSDGDGGAIDFDGAGLIQQSTFSGNEALDGDGGALDQSDGGPFIVDSSTFVGNTAAFDGGAISGQDLVTVVNSTFTGNNGITIIGTYLEEGGGGDAISLTYVTIAGNTVAGEGGEGGAAPAVVRANDGGDLTSFGTAIVDNIGGPNCEFTTTASSSYSYSSDSSCDLDGTGDTEDGGPAGLEALASNGGPTQTMAIGQTSPLFDAIPTSACDPGLITDDQRGEPRPGNLTEGCDIGAFELQLEEPPVTPPPTGGPLTPLDPGTGPIAGRPGFTG
jgi:predicted outer membrane repeat protein